MFGQINTKTVWRNKKTHKLCTFCKQSKINVVANKIKIKNTRRKRVSIYEKNVIFGVQNSIQKKR